MMTMLMHIAKTNIVTDSWELVSATQGAMQIAIGACHGKWGLPCK